MILRRASAAQTEQKEVLRTRTRRVEETGPVGNANSHRPRGAVIDINHLTDRVIQAIDRRIIAQRERLGRA